MLNFATLRIDVRKILAVFLDHQCSTYLGFELAGLQLGAFDYVMDYGKKKSRVTGQALLSISAVFCFQIHFRLNTIGLM